MASANRNSSRTACYA